MNEQFNLDFENMTPDELKAFRDQFDPDAMGFDGAEGVDKDDE